MKNKHELKQLPNENAGEPQAHGRHSEHHAASADHDHAAAHSEHAHAAEHSEHAAPTHLTAPHLTPHRERMVISWVAPEYIRHQKSAKWYACAAAVTAAAIIWGFFSDNWTMVLAVVAFTFVYNYIDIKHPPKHIKIEISEMGVKVGHMFWDYQKIKAFWIIYEHGLRTLNLRVTNNFFSDIIIQMGEQDPVPVRQYMVTQIPEWEGKTERLGDMILRLFRL